METYKLKVKCNNCYHKWVEKFEKGVRPTNFVKCPNCECKEGITCGKPTGEYDYKVD